jgi:hypothetical protein
LVVPLYAQIAFVGFRVASAESGLLSLAARSTEFVDSGIGVGDERRMRWRKFLFVRETAIPGCALHHA